MPTPNFNFPTINQNDTANVPRDLNALATAIDTAFQQTEYQTATVVGAQIRITKPSASNRVFFRLANTINGGNAITISTDGGSTSVNLTDTDGTNVTMLEKGFAEIVKVGNFFILRNRGLNPAQLQALITITNEAEANESVLRTNYVDTVNGLISPPPLSSDASWNDILLQIPNVNSDRPRIKAGTYQVTATTLSFAQSNGSLESYRYFQVSDIGFTPKQIIVFSNSLALPITYIESRLAGTYKYSTTEDSRFFRIDGNSVVTSALVRLPSNTPAGTIINYIMYE